MVRVVTRKEIERVLPRLDLVGRLQDGFIAYSKGEVTVPPPGELLFTDPPGDVHIKYGCIDQDDVYVIKVASGFYRNPELGLASSQGLMLVFSRRTGQPRAILLDEGRLTDVRTAAAGALVARHFAPSTVDRIGIVGAGTQARLQLLHLLPETDACEALIWVRNNAAERGFREAFEHEDRVPTLHFTRDIREVAQRCELIVTTTPSETPLLHAADLRPGTHITAVGSDTPIKCELEPEILARADIVVVDSLAQSEHRGEVYQAVRAGAIDRRRVVKLGHVLVNHAAGRTDDGQTTVVDLTGVAVQDIQIAKAVIEALGSTA